MPADNVTPFRRPPKRPVAPQQRGGIGLKTHRGKAVLVHALTLTCFLFPFVLGGLPFARIIGIAIGIAAALIAYTSRNDSMPWAMTHHEHALRTLMFGFLGMTVLGLPSYVLSPDLVGATAIGWYNLIYLWGVILITIWAALRAVVVLVLAAMRRPVPHPHGWFI